MLAGSTMAETKRAPALLAAGLTAASVLVGCTGDIGALVAPDGPRGTPAPSIPAGPTGPTGPVIVPPPPPPPPFAPGPGVVRRVVASQYTATIAALLGPEAAMIATPPPDAALNGLDAVGASQLALDDGAVRAHEASSRAVAAAAVTAGARDRWAGCAPRTVDDEACFRTFVSRFGRALFRRALDAEEIDAWVALAREAATRTNDFDRGLTWLIAAQLQAPSFLYRVELGEPDPARPGQSKLTAHELATRLAFFLTGHGPDEALLDAADRDELSTREQVRAQAERLIAADEARAALATHYDELLRLRELPTVSKNAQLFPALDDGLRRSMREETQRLIADIVWERDADFRDFFDADYTFVDSPLARLYGLPDRGRGFQRVALDAASKRGGYLGQASFHTLQSHATTTSPTLRGKFIREVLLCQPIPAPPPGVSTTLPADPPGGARTNRERLEVHMTTPSCAGCHQLMDPLGFGLEGFDPIGAFRTQEPNGMTIEAESALDGARFEGAGQLGALLKPMRAAMVCTTRGLYRQAVGRIEGRSEEESVQDIVAAFEASGWKMKALLAEIAASDGFRYVRAN